MIKFFLVVVVVCLALGGYSIYRLKSAGDRQAEEQQGVEKVESDLGEEKRERRELPVVRIVKSDVNAPVIETDEGSYRRGNLVLSGEVKDLRSGIAKVQWEDKTQYDVTSANMSLTEVVNPVGTVWLGDGRIDAVMLSDGDVLRVGRFCKRGEVVAMSPGRADVRRQDGGWLYVCFAAVRSTDGFGLATTDSQNSKPPLPIVP